MKTPDNWADNNTTCHVGSAATGMVNTDFGSNDATREQGTRRHGVFFKVN